MHHLEMVTRTLPHRMRIQQISCIVSKNAQHFNEFKNDDEEKRRDNERDRYRRKKTFFHCVLTLSIGLNLLHVVLNRIP